MTKLRRQARRMNRYVKRSIEKDPQWIIRLVFRGRTGLIEHMAGEDPDRPPEGR